MTLHRKGNASPEKREGHMLLTARSPRIENLLGGIHFDGFDLEQARRFGNALLRARDARADRNRHGRRYSEVETSRQCNRFTKGSRKVALHGGRR